MNSFHRGTDIEVAVSIEGIIISELSNLLVIVLDPISREIKKLALNHEFGYNSDDISSFDDSTIEVVIQRSETTNLIYGDYFFKIIALYPDGSFVDDVRYDSDSVGVFKIVSDSKSTSTDERITIGIPVLGEGKSAFDVAVDNGFIGTEQEWLDSLVGIQG